MHGVAFNVVVDTVVNDDPDTLTNVAVKYAVPPTGYKSAIMLLDKTTGTLVPTRAICVILLNELVDPDMVMTHKFSKLLILNDNKAVVDVSIIALPMDGAAVPTEILIGVFTVIVEPDMSSTTEYSEYGDTPAADPYTISTFDSDMLWIQAPLKETVTVVVDSTVAVADVPAPDISNKTAVKLVEPELPTNAIARVADSRAMP